MYSERPWLQIYLYVERTDSIGQLVINQGCRCGVNIITSKDIEGAGGAISRIGAVFIARFRGYRHIVEFHRKLGEST